MKVDVGMEKYLLDALANDNEVNIGVGWDGVQWWWAKGLRVDRSQCLLIGKWKLKLRNEWIHLMWLRIQNPFSKPIAFFLVSSRLISFSTKLCETLISSPIPHPAADESKTKKLRRRCGIRKATLKKNEKLTLHVKITFYIFFPHCCFK